jgi:Fumarase
MEYRIEHDSMGEVKVPADRYWGAQTERSHENFPIGVGIETMPKEIVHAFGILKKAAAIANNKVRKEKMTDEKLAPSPRLPTRSSHFPSSTIFRLSSGRPEAAHSRT